MGVISLPKIKFIQTSSGKKLEMDLISHYTSVLGMKSAEGKTWFYNYVRSEITNGSVIVKSELPYVFADTLNIDRILETDERSIILVDELTLNRTSNMFNTYNSTKHLIVSISRTLPFNLTSPLQGLYTIKEKDGWFTCDKLNELKLACADYKYDIVITEACAGRSENELLKQWRPDLIIIPANGNIKIPMTINKISKQFSEKNILVLLDLFNVGQQYQALVHVQKNNPNVRFYNYGCFEEMLFKSNFIDGTVENTHFLDFPTLEQYYENILEKFTRNKPYQYIHRKPLPSCYLSECSSCYSKCDKFCNNKFQNIVGKDSCLLKNKIKAIDFF